VARVNFYYALDPNWSPPESGEVRVIASVRNGAPLSIEKRFGDGRVVAHLCKLSPRPTELGEWSNWAVNPVFPVFANELVGYLSATQRRFDVRGVDEPVSLTVAEAEYQPEVTIRPPNSADGGTTAVAPTAKNGQYLIEAPTKPRSGVWQFELKARDGKPETRYVAVNVAPEEGDLALLTQEELAQRLRGIDYQYSLASALTETQEELSGFRLADALLYTLAGVLIIEQLFAVSASYHPGSERRAA
jgi:hypothetical protein